MLTGIDITTGSDKRPSPSTERLSRFEEKDIMTGSKRCGSGKTRHSATNDDDALAQRSFQSKKSTGYKPGPEDATTGPDQNWPEKTAF